ncbi:MAG: BCD family MFS transporter [Oscillatoriales cyanobacterium SM2_1_8]|nr:BCD family MFS transporter [Oscillatoriales cyanobacterium SM2_1_8]
MAKTGSRSGRSLRILTANRQTGIFFGFLIALTIALFLQEPVLEPYGGEVFGMSYSETTRLNAYWGMGVLVGYVVAGFYAIRRFGKQNTTAAGCAAVGVSFLLVGLAGFGANVPLLLTVLVVFGVASGIATAGAINLMLDLTAAETAGTFIGAWGLSQALSRGTATTLGGGLLDLGKRLFAEPALSYALVFGVQALVALVAFLLLRRVNVEEFQQDAQASLVAVLETDLD